MILASIDPGISGAVTVMSATRFAEARPNIIMLEDCCDMPTMEVGTKNRINVSRLRAWLNQYEVDEAIIEDVQVAMPPGGKGKRKSFMSPSAAMQFGRSIGHVEGVIVGAFGCPIHTVRARDWQALFGLKARDKEGSRQKALAMVRGADKFLARKMDHNRAESMLIGLYRLKQLGMW